MRIPRKSGLGKKINIAHVGPVSRGAHFATFGHFSPFMFPLWYKWWIELLPKATEFKYLRVLIIGDSRMDRSQLKWVTIALYDSVLIMLSHHPAF